eukprot:COSAG05_NODE_280_length_12288_cov_4.797933_16_plen_386_part_00
MASEAADAFAIRTLLAQRDAARAVGDFSVADEARHKLFQQHRCTVEHDGSAWRRWPPPPPQCADGCQVWLRGRDGKAGGFCLRPRADTEAAEAVVGERLVGGCYYCEAHVAKHHGRVLCPLEPTHTVPLNKLNRHVKVCGRLQKDSNAVCAKRKNATLRRDKRGAKHRADAVALARRIADSSCADGTEWDKPPTTAFPSGSSPFPSATDGVLCFVIHVAGGLEPYAVRNLEILGAQQIFSLPGKVCFASSRSVPYLRTHLRVAESIALLVLGQPSPRMPDENNPTRSGQKDEKEVSCSTAATVATSASAAAWLDAFKVILQELLGCSSADNSGLSSSWASSGGQIITGGAGGGRCDLLLALEPAWRAAVTSAVSVRVCVQLIGHL